ncbi:IFM1 protein, partial [Urocolius indicus]|nr:IFM1 protein [Urocolius indicus]
PEPGGMEQSCSLSRALPPYEPLPDGADTEGLPRSTVVSVEPPLPPPPRDHLVWSLCTSLYGNICCLGFMALVFSIKSRDRKLLRDYSGALSYGSTAKYLNITALLIHIFIVILIVALVASGTIVALNRYRHQPSSFDGPT